MDRPRDPQALADELERQGRELQERSGQLGERLQETRQEWERKRRDSSVPGANPPEGPEGEREERPGSEGSPAPQAPPQEEED